MPTPIAHTLAAYAALISIEPKLASDRQSNSIALGAAFAFGSLADADFFVAHFTRNPVLQHHFFSHSYPFTVLVALVCFVVLGIKKNSRPGRNALLLGTAYATHLLLDYFTEDGSKPYGIPLLWPFSSHHFISPFTVFYSIHRGEWSDLLSLHNLGAIAVELGVMLPIAFLAFLPARNRKGTVERFAEILVRQASRLAPDHHSQGLVFVSLLVVAGLLQSWTMAIATAGFALFHFCYGGEGTFQTPLRSKRKPGIPDIALVMIGLVSLIVYGVLLIVIAARRLQMAFS